MRARKQIGHCNYLDDYLFSNINYLIAYRYKNYLLDRLYVFIGSSDGPCHVVINAVRESWLK